jgi:hypothetical protein
MADTLKPSEPELVSCETCLKEIPASVARSPEGEEYIHHFCGLECYRRWQEEKMTAGDAKTP